MKNYTQREKLILKILRNFKLSSLEKSEMLMLNEIIEIIEENY